MNVLYLGYEDADARREGLGREAEELQQAALEAGQAVGIAVLVRRNVDWDEVRDLLVQTRPDVLHVSCHGRPGGKLRILRGGAFVDVAADALADALVASGAPPRLVVLSACFGAEVADALAARGMAACGWNERVPVTMAARMARLFYRRLFEVRKLQEALSLAQADFLPTEEELRGALRVRLPGHADLELPPARPVTLTPAPATRGGRPPDQVVLLLNAYPRGLSREELLAQVEDRRNERRIFELRTYLERLGVPALSDHAGNPPWTLLARATQQLLDDVQTFIGSLPSGPDWYVGGQAPHATFAHVGYGMSGWSGRLVLVHRDPVPGAPVLTVDLGAPLPPGAVLLSGADAERNPLDGTGYVGLYVDAVRGPPPPGVPDDVRNHLRSLSDGAAGCYARWSKLADPARAGDRLAMDALRAHAAAADFQHLVATFSNELPQASGAALYLRTPGILALLLGRALTPRLCRRVLLTWYDRQANGYATAYELPLPPPRRPLSTGPADDLARRAVLDAVVQGMRDLVATLTTELLVPPSAMAADPDGVAEEQLELLRDLQLPTRPDGEGFRLDPDRPALSLGADLLEALRPMPADQLAIFGRLLLLHEAVHGEQGVHDGNYRGLGRAGVVLEDVDYWGDAYAHLVHVRWQLARGGPAARDALKDLLGASLRVGLLGLAAFDRMGGDLLRQLPERRLRRYLLWALQAARARTVRTPEDAERMFAQRLFVELAPLRGELDERGDKLVFDPPADAELFVGLGGRVRRITTVRENFSPAALVGHVRTFEVDALVRALDRVVGDQRDMLAPWSVRRRGHGAAAPR